MSDYKVGDIVIDLHGAAFQKTSDTEWKLLVPKQDLTYRDEYIKTMDKAMEFHGTPVNKIAKAALAYDKAALAHVQDYFRRLNMTIRNPDEAALFLKPGDLVVDRYGYYFKKRGDVFDEAGYEGGTDYSYARMDYPLTLIAMEIV